ncbi:MAG TPA: hypothetical protein DCL41_06760 [Bdellovibrionales bacterium]|nr:hypothetical protein [Pseudobdellovibrionaceae bacterium]HAG91553.1 hypothetical protein [Bdellovibrionales bacterium]|tara:strand:- start:574 stop:1044 length:471 start_codon:yes stop_codon:yes gene_type:complete
MKQLSLIPKPNLECGESLQNSGKQKRILSSRRPTHLVLKAHKNTLFKHRNFIQQTLEKQAANFHHKLLTWSVQKDHIHLLIRFFDRLSYIKFIRALTGLIARKLGRGLWKFRPYTKVLSWGRETWNVNNYIFRNELEVFKFWKYKPRPTKFQPSST